MQCTVYSRTFRREQDKARHKCIEERVKPVHQQQGAPQRTAFGRWFKSKGDLAVHNCIELTSINRNITEHVPNSAVDNRVHCSVCERSFNWSSNLK